MSQSENDSCHMATSYDDGGDDGDSGGADDSVDGGGNDVDDCGGGGELTVVGDCTDDDGFKVMRGRENDNVGM